MFAGGGVRLYCEAQEAQAGAAFPCFLEGVSTATPGPLPNAMHPMHKDEAVTTVAGLILDAESTKLPSFERQAPSST